MISVHGRIQRYDVTYPRVAVNATRGPYVALCATQGPLGSRSKGQGFAEPLKALRGPLVGFCAAAGGCTGSPSPRLRRASAAERSQSAASAGSRKYSRRNWPSCVTVIETAPRSRVVPTETRTPSDTSSVTPSGTRESMKAGTSIADAVWPLLKKSSSIRVLSLACPCVRGPDWPGQRDTRDAGASSLASPCLSRRSSWHGGRDESTGLSDVARLRIPKRLGRDRKDDLFTGSPALAVKPFVNTSVLERTK
jgi:hypothetical protein